MTRGGRPKERDGPERRCIVHGDSGATDRLIRFVVGPEGRLAPDIAEKLPGRGIWVTSERDALERAAAKNLFSRAARQRVKIPSDLIEIIESGLVRRVIDAISLCRKAGLAVAGAEKCRAAASTAAVLVQAFDSSEAGRVKMRRLAPSLPEITCLSQAELGFAFGRSSIVHAVLAPGGATGRAVREANRLQGVRDG